jgi:dihydroorotase, multifunctional complex type
MRSYLIKNGHLIDPANRIDEKMDLRISEGKITDVQKELAPGDNEEVIDAQGMVVAPGFIDLHCHLREPGQEAKEDLISGTNSAAAGGFTTILTMANTRPIIDQAIIVAGMKHKIAEDSLIHVELVGAVTKNLEGKELAEIGDMASAGVAAFSDDGGYVSDSRVMRSAFEYASLFGLPIISHAEDDDLVEEGVMHEGSVSAQLGLKGRPAVAEDIAVARELMLAELTGGRIHIAHVSSKGAVELIRAAKKKGIAVTAEVTPHHLCLTDERVRSFDSAFKVNPPLRDQEHVDALLVGLKDGTLDAVTTDHAPHAYEEKDCEFSEAPSGFAGFETAFGAMCTHYVEAGKLTLAELIEKMTFGPAKAFGWQNKGELGKGRVADLVFIDPEKVWKVESKEFYTRGKASPFDGQEFVGKVMSTMAGGKWVYQDGKVMR